MSAFELSPSHYEFKFLILQVSNLIFDISFCLMLLFKLQLNLENKVMSIVFVMQVAGMPQNRFNLIVFWLPDFCLSTDWNLFEELKSFYFLYRIFDFKVLH